jgi:hypothetical protein
MDIRTLAGDEDFEAPCPEAVAALAVGDVVKLAVVEKGHHEKMWFEIVSVGDGRYEGELRSQPFAMRTISKGARLPFEPRHVLDVKDLIVPAPAPAPTVSAPAFR